MQESRYIIIFEAIRSILEESGIESLTMANISARCHLHPNTVSYYFNGKLDMLMRFHTYMSDAAISKRPEYYTRVPDDTKEAVWSFISIVDLVIFESDLVEPLRLKLHNHLVGMMHEYPQIRRYYSERHYAEFKQMRQIIYMYADSGIVSPESLEEGISTLAMVSAGNTMLQYYYGDWRPAEMNIHYERKRILQMMINPQLRPYLDAFIQ